MKATEYEVKIFKKENETYTKFTIGMKANKLLLEKTIIALGGKLVKQTKLAKHYELKGNQLTLALANVNSNTHFEKNANRWKE